MSKVHAKLFLYLKGSPRILESCSSNESGRQGRRLLSTKVSKVLFFLLVAEYSFSVFVLLFSSEWNDFSVIMLGGGVEISWGTQNCEITWGTQNSTVSLLNVRYDFVG